MKHILFCGAAALLLAAGQSFAHQETKDFARRDFTFFGDVAKSLGLA